MVTAAIIIVPKHEIWGRGGVLIWNHLNLFKSKPECFGQTIFFLQVVRKPQSGAVLTACMLRDRDRWTL